MSHMSQWFTHFGLIDLYDFIFPFAFSFVTCPLS